MLSTNCPKKCILFEAGSSTEGIDLLTPIHGGIDVYVSNFITLINSQDINVVELVPYPLSLGPTYHNETISSMYETYNHDGCELPTVRLV